MTQVTMPTVDLIRQVTDRHVLSQLIAEPALTRAELAGRTGISKPTVSESVRRLAAAGLIAETGRQSGKRGPSGVFYGLQEGAGYALAVTIAPGAVVAETCDLRGDRLRRAEERLPGPVTAAQVDPVVSRLVDEAVRGLPGSPIGAAVNLAGPVDQRSGRLVRLPNSPYFIEAFDPARTFRDRVQGPVRLDNDVNWTAAAEHSQGAAVGLDDFVYAYLGPGIGAAVYAGGNLIRGHRGFAGELANVVTVGPAGLARRLADCFADWELRTPGSEAIDVAAVAAVLTDSNAADARAEQIVRAVAGAVASLAAALDPEVVVIGGPWGAAGGLDRRVASLVDADPATRAHVHPATLGADAAHRGARNHAVSVARDELLTKIA